MKNLTVKELLEVQGGNGGVNTIKILDMEIPIGTGPTVPERPKNEITY